MKLYFWREWSPPCCCVTRGIPPRSLHAPIMPSLLAQLRVRKIEILLPRFGNYRPRLKSFHSHLVRLRITMNGRRWLIWFLRPWQTDNPTSEIFTLFGSGRIFPFGFGWIRWICGVTKHRFEFFSGNVRNRFGRFVGVQGRLQWQIGFKCVLGESVLPLSVAFDRQAQTAISDPEGKLFNLISTHVPVVSTPVQFHPINPMTSLTYRKVHKYSTCVSELLSEQ